MTKINQEQEAKVMGHVRKGVPVLLGEFRLSRVDTVRWNDKKTGAARSAQVIRYTVEGESEAFPVSEFLPDGSDLTNWKCPYSKGQTVLVLIAGFFTEKGQSTIRGAVVAV